MLNHFIRDIKSCRHDILELGPVIFIDWINWKDGVRFFWRCNIGNYDVSQLWRCLISVFFLFSIPSLGFLCLFWFLFAIFISSTVSYLFLVILRLGF